MARGRKPKEGPEVIYQIKELVESFPPMKVSTAINHLGRSLGWHPIKPIKERLRKRYRELKKRGELPQEMPIPKEMAEAFDRAFQDREYEERYHQESLAKWEVVARGLGIDPSLDDASLLALEHNLQTETDRLSSVALGPLKTRLDLVMEGNPATTEEAKQRYIRLADEHRGYMKRLNAVRALLSHRSKVGGKKNPLAREE